MLNKRTLNFFSGRILIIVTFFGIYLRLVGRIAFIFCTLPRFSTLVRPLTFFFSYSPCKCGIKRIQQKIFLLSFWVGVIDLRGPRGHPSCTQLGCVGLPVQCLHFSAAWGHQWWGPWEPDLFVLRRLSSARDPALCLVSSLKYLPDPNRNYLLILAQQKFNIKNSRVNNC